jgi:hypothetical protein
MKIHWVIILLSLLNSCKLTDVVEHNQDTDIVIEVVDTTHVEFPPSPIITLDTINVSNIEEYIDSKEIEEYVYVEYIKSVILDIEDQTSDTPKNTEGMVAYSVPNEMQVGNPYTIKLRITKIKDNSSKIDLILGERSNNTIYEGDVDTKVIIENIRVESLMSASLIGDEEKFYINEMSTKTQVLEDSSYTEWSWVVNPLKGGNNHLKMIITVVINDDGYSKDIVVFDKSIEVRSNIKFSVNTWFSSYWQWLMTTIIIPITIWIYRKRKKKRESKNFTIEL